ncbi:regulation of enolase protein 1 isoform X2 [Lingula anatina]|nr:regulation of enolase protein 1 isoform X2 [Lingula anatina]|eukprot:XP_013404649.1 regulation of enolase protein 1 isoform X2 [Lingula anatina]
MSSSGDQTFMSTSFASDQLPDGLKWYTEPKTWRTKARNNKGLLAITEPKTDFWQKTYYEPLLVADNGHFLYLDVSQEKVVMETEFEIKSSDQFDQCGLMVRTDTLHWIKCGIEYVDGHPGLGCVVTNDFSDWSKQDWQGNRLCLRLYR